MNFYIMTMPVDGDAVMRLLTGWVRASAGVGYGGRDGFVWEGGKEGGKDGRWCNEAGSHPPSLTTPNHNIQPRKGTCRHFPPSCYSLIKE